MKRNPQNNQFLAEPPLRRFWNKITITESGCWEWNGWLSGGYGGFHDGIKDVRAHRFALLNLRGIIVPPGMQPDHLCRNRKCVNPYHLEIVTPRENVMRSNAPAATRQRWQSRTHCKHGHLLVEENIYYTSDRARRCRICQRESQHKYQLKLKSITQKKKMGK